MKTKIATRCFVFLAATLLAAETAHAVAPGDERLVRPGIYRLDGIDPNLPTGDLAPLRRLIGNAEFVALGEAVHTSGGFYEAKHRLFRFLVEEMGFRGFGLENPWTKAEPLARYVETCEGSVQEAMRPLFGVWESLETQALFEWMCEWNRTHPKEQDKIHLFGYDIQDNAAASGPALIDFLKRIGVPEDDPKISAILGCDHVVDRFFPFEPFPEDRYQRCIAALDETGALFEAREKEIVKLTSKDDLGWAKVHLVSLRHSQEQLFVFFTDQLRAFTVRDEGMAKVAEMIRALRVGRHGKVALWAHNAHISKNRAYDLDSMGTFLDEKLGKDYVALALTASEVSWDWLGDCGVVPFPRGEDPVEDLLQALGEDYLLVDLDFPRADPPFLTPGKTYDLGWAPIVPRDGFDGIIYLRVSPAMAPLSWPACPPQ